MALPTLIEEKDKAWIHKMLGNKTLETTLRLIETYSRHAGHR